MVAGNTKDSAKVGIRCSDSRPQVFIAGASGFETGAKTIRKDDYKPQASGAATRLVPRLLQVPMRMLWM